MKSLWVAPGRKDLTKILHKVGELSRAESAFANVKFIGIYNGFARVSKTAHREHIEVRTAVDSSLWSKSNKSQKMIQENILQTTSKMNQKRHLKNKEAASGLPKVAKPL